MALQRSCAFAPICCWRMLTRCHRSLFVCGFVHSASVYNIQSVVSYTHGNVPSCQHTPCFDDPVLLHKLVPGAVCLQPSQTWSTCRVLPRLGFVVMPLGFRFLLHNPELQGSSSSLGGSWCGAERQVFPLEPVEIHQPASSPGNFQCLKSQY